MRYGIYIFSTILYGVVALVGIFAAGYFVTQGDRFLFVLSTAVVYVAIDNFFCGSRARASGQNVTGHYALPVFLRGE